MIDQAFLICGLRSRVLMLKGRVYYEKITL